MKIWRSELLAALKTVSDWPLFPLFSVHASDVFSSFELLHTLLSPVTLDISANTLRPNSLFSLSFPVLYLLIWTPWGSWQESRVSSEDLRWSGHPVTKVQLTFVQHLKPKFVFFSNKEWVLYLWIWTPGCSWLDSWVSWEHPWWSGHNTNLCFHFFSFLIMGRARARTRQTRRGVQHECSFSCCVAAVCIFFLRSVCSSWPTASSCSWPPCLPVLSRRAH